MKTHKLILENDSVNSFQYVVACLIKFANQEPKQAEQCAIIAHNYGKCSVLSGTFNDVFDAKSNFERVNLKTTIDIYEGEMYQ